MHNYLFYRRCGIKQIHVLKKSIDMFFTEAHLTSQIRLTQGQDCLRKHAGGLEADLSNPYPVTEYRFTKSQLGFSSKPISKLHLISV